MTRNLLYPFAMLMLGLLPALLRAQTDRALLRELAEENKKSVEALALYPLDTRLAILEACKYPEVLIKMNNAREKTSAAFRTQIEDFPQSVQQTVYDLVRYPGLISILADRRSDPEGMRKALLQLPENQRDAAFDFAADHPLTLRNIDQLNRTAEKAFEDMIAPYPPTAQAAFRQLVQLPEVLDILNQDLRFTILVGDVYKEDPAWVIHQTDSLNLAVARSQAEELAEWKNEVEQDPQVQAELNAAATEYARDYGYDDQSYPYDDDVYYDGRHEPPAYVAYHYPWWFGYPWWYGQPCWRPYPWWYDWGFYPYHSHTVVIVYMPSWQFMEWYFDHPHHHYHYNHLSAAFVNHYYGHRRSGTTISMGVGAWRDHNRDIMTDDWLQDRSKLPDRLREYGRFEEKREAFNARNPQQQVSRNDFLNKNARQYPELAREQEQVSKQARTAPAEMERKPSDWAPKKEPARTEPAGKPEPARQPAPAP
ncbi:MAG TPA: hypothetical protein PLW66_13930, partial [Saprospiraceae bacterium]|nr:hypothetical protein [Saprospiraceae bacterium]